MLLHYGSIERHWALRPAFFQKEIFKISPCHILRLCNGSQAL